MKRLTLLLSSLFVVMIVALAFLASPGQKATAEMTPLDKQKEKIASELGDLEERYFNSLNLVGWVHTTSKLYINFGEGGGTLPDGKIIPGEVISESWLFVDNNGIVTEKINLQKTMEGEILQISVEKDGLAKNLTYDITTESTSPMTSRDIIGEFSFEVTSTINNEQMKIDREFVTLNGKDTLCVSLSKEYAEPLPGDHVGKIKTWKKRAFYDPDTGMFSGIETVVQTETGEELTANGFIIIELETLEQLPFEISQYLEE